MQKNNFNVFYNVTVIYTLQNTSPLFSSSYYFKVYVHRNVTDKNICCLHSPFEKVAPELTRNIYDG